MQLMRNMYSIACILQRHINMQFNGLSIAQTNIKQEFGLAEYVPTKHWGDLLPFRIVFKGSSKLPC